jgi:hypothetical protein
LKGKSREHKYFPFKAMALSQCENGAVTFTKGLTPTPKSQPMSTHHLNNSWPQPHILLNSLIQCLSYAEIVRFLFNVTLSVIRNYPWTELKNNHNAGNNRTQLEESAFLCSQRGAHAAYIMGVAESAEETAREAKGRLQHNPQKRCWLSCVIFCAPPVD